jgi:hypothetical protein
MRGFKGEVMLGSVRTDAGSTLTGACVLAQAMDNFSSADASALAVARDDILFILPLVEKSRVLASPACLAARPRR